MSCLNNDKREVGVMGGSFNPIHNGHLILANKAYEQFNIPKILFMPAGIPYFKNHEGIVSADDRCNMVSLAIEPFEFMELSRLEVDREGNTYTADTIRVLKESYDKIYFILGADSLFDIDRWKNPDYILSNCTILAANRGNHEINDIEIRVRYLKDKYKADIHIIDMEKNPVSSTDVRKACADNDSLVNTMIPETVYSYIKNKNLYQ